MSLTLKYWQWYSYRPNQGVALTTDGSTFQTAEYDQTDQWYKKIQVEAH